MTQEEIAGYLIVGILAGLSIAALSYAIWDVHFGWAKWFFSLPRCQINNIIEQIHIKTGRKYILNWDYDPDMVYWMWSWHLKREHKRNLRRLRRECKKSEL